MTTTNYLKSGFISNFFHGLIIVSALMAGLIIGLILPIAVTWLKCGQVLFTPSMRITACCLAVLLTIPSVFLAANRSFNWWALKLSEHLAEKWDANIIVNIVRAWDAKDWATITAILFFWYLLYVFISL